ncbi:hypothetical protein PENTCL1PPCAC_12486, partial [Pristionchus entomophagus]
SGMPHSAAFFPIVEEWKTKICEYAIQSDDIFIPMISTAFDAMYTILKISKHCDIKRTLEALDFERSLYLRSGKTKETSVRSLMYGVIESLHLTLVHLTSSRSSPTLPLKPQEESIEVSRLVLHDDHNSVLDNIGDKMDIQELEMLNDDMISGMNDSALAEENTLNKSLLVDDNMEDPVDRKIMNDNMDSMEEYLIEVGIEKKDISVKKSRSKSVKRVGNAASSAMHQCKVCSRVFKTENSITIHTSIAHNPNKIYKARAVKTHPFPCQICSYRSTSQTGLATHMCMHTGARPHKCTIGECSEGFVSSTVLKKHQLIVHNMKPYHCSICGEKFDKLRPLNRHKAEHSPMDNHCESSLIEPKEEPTDEFPSMPVEKENAPSAVHQCTACFRFFKTKGSLHTHASSVHKGQKKYKPRRVNSNLLCGLCPFTSNSQTALAAHLCIHTGELPHKCTVGDCPEGFTSSAALKQHHREVHKLKPFDCSICGEKFYKFGWLIHHKREHEKESPDSLNVEKNGRPSRNAPRPLRYTDVLVNSDRNVEPARKKSRSKSEMWRQVANQCAFSMNEPPEEPVELVSLEIRESSGSLNGEKNGSSRNDPRPLKYTDVLVNSDGN